MPLALDASVGGAASNSYATVAAAESAATFRAGGNATAWVALTPDQKVMSLVTATRDIDTVRFKGGRASTTQALEWPRTGTQYASNILPKPLVDATIELAFSYAPAFAAGASVDPLNADDSAARIKREQVGEVEVEYFTPPSAPGEQLARLPAIVQRLLAPLVWVASGGWGRSTVARAS